MPVLRIEALVGPGADVPALLTTVAGAAAAAFEVPLEHCWATFSPLAPGAYLEGGRVRGEADALEASPLVTVTAAHGRDPERKAAVLRAVARAVGAALGVDPDLVFVEYREIPPGHVHTGGSIR